MINKIPLSHEFENYISGETREYYYEVDVEDFYNNKQVQFYIVKEFAETYGITISKAEEIIEDYDLWRDELLLEGVLFDFNSELDAVLWNEKYWDGSFDYERFGVRE